MLGPSRWSGPNSECGELPLMAVEESLAAADHEPAGARLKNANCRNSFFDQHLGSCLRFWGPRILIRPNTRFHVATIHYISFPCSRKTPMSISRYIVVAAVKFSWACSGLPLRR
jgi:hypothetical protein